MNAPRTLIAATLALAAIATACNNSDGNTTPAPDGTTTTATQTPTADGTTTIGKIDRFPGGTAVITSDHTLISITCANEQLILTTTAAVFTANMPCDRMVPPDVVDRFLQKPITITIADGRLKIENPEAGTLDFPATDVKQ